MPQKCRHRGYMSQQNASRLKMPKLGTILKRRLMWESEEREKGLRKSDSRII